MDEVDSAWSQYRNSGFNVMKLGQGQYKIIFIFIFLCLGGCAPVKWGAMIDKSVELRWPPPPNPVKIIYNGQLTGFRPTG